MTIKGNAHLPYNTYEMLDNLYLSYFTNIKPFEDVGYANNESDNFSFGLQNYLYFYKYMHQISGDSKWLVLIGETCEHILDNTDAKRHERGEIILTPLADPQVDTNYYQAPYPYALNGEPVLGWSSFDGSPQPRLRCQVLQDGQIIGAFCEIAEYIKDNNITMYSELANTLLDYSSQVIASHDNSYRYGSTVDGGFVAGTYKYPNRLTGDNSVFSNPLAYNHCGGLIKAMLIINKYTSNEEYISKAEAFMQFTRDYRDEVDNERYVWDYNYNIRGTYEDINHGSYSLDMIYKAYSLGKLGVTKNEMRKYTNSILKANRWPSVSDANEKVDGSGTLPTGEVFDIGSMAYLGEFNKDIITLGKLLTATNYIPKYPSYFRSVSCLLFYTEFSER